MNTSESSGQTEFVIEPSKKFSLNFRELWQYRELFYFFTWRDLKVKYKQTTLGVLWVVLQPIITVVVFSLFFGRALRVPSGGIPYPVFVFSGLLLWTFFSSGISNASNSMLSQAAIIKKIYFPRMVLPVSAILVAFIDYLVAFVVFIAVLLYFQTDIDFLAVLIFWPASLFLMILGTLGISCWLAALVVKYRDFRYLIPFSLQILLFLTPIIYPISVINHTWIKYVLAVNPITAAITMFRMPFIPYQDSPWLIIISVVSAFIFTLCGIYYFKRVEDFFADLA